MQHLRVKIHSCKELGLGNVVQPEPKKSVNFAVKTLCCAGANAAIESNRYMLQASIEQYL